MDHKWTHGFEYQSGAHAEPRYSPNALLSAGIDRALRLWAGQDVSGWSAIRLLDAGDAVIAEAPTTNTVESGQLRAAATFTADEITSPVVTVRLLAGSVEVAEASLSAPADQALVVTRVDTLIEAP